LLTNPYVVSSFLRLSEVYKLDCLQCEVVTGHFSNMTKSRSQRSQGLSRLRPKVVLSKEARACLTAQRCQKSKDFKVALDDAWLSIDNAVKTIASSHHKSIRRVTNDLYMGCGGLRFKCSKSNAWNAFCWKKNQEKDENGMMHFLFCSSTDSAISSN
jgi:uncharacterized protein (DUF2237 family)